MKIYDVVCQQFNPKADWIVTGRKRLATAFRQYYANYQYQQGYQVFESPCILHITAFIKHLWATHSIRHPAEPALLLTGKQTQALWETIIMQSAVPIQNLKTVTTLAQQAWMLCQQWGINRQAEDFGQLAAQQTWQAWAAEFTHQCHTQAWLDSTQIIPTLIEKQLLEKQTLPQQIFLLGIDTLNPQYQSLLRQLQLQGCKLHWTSLEDLKTAHPPSPKPYVKRIALADTATELSMMAQWACQAWQQRGETVACVIPQLATLRTQVIATFQEVWRGLCQHPTATQFPFILSGGDRASCHPMIGIALDILSLETSIEFVRFSRILRSPWLKHVPQEKSQRMKLDQILRQQGEERMSKSQLIAWSRRYHCPVLAQILEAWRPPHVDHLPPARPPSQWAAYFSDQLAVLGWPGEENLASEEYQWMTGWLDLLDAFSGLDVVLKTLDHGAALQKLTQIATDTTFQASTSHPQPIHILDMLEVTGLYFDQLWVMGLDDTVWPPATQMNPFIPHRLQRKQQIPHATPEQAYQAAYHATRRLAHSADAVIFSYPKAREDQILNPSALIMTTELPYQEITRSDLSLSTHPSLSAQITEQVHWEYQQDAQAPPLALNSTIRGGAQLLKTQADCPFKAFAYYRLGLSRDALNLPQPGLSAAERGQLLHQLLENVWRALGDQATLLSYSTTKLDALLNHIIQTALAQAAVRKPHLWQPAFTQVEKQRLHTRLKNWLDIERERPAFQVFALEQPQTLRLASLRLQLRIDRIDQLADGTTLFIDYKTSKSLSHQDWLGDRPTEPQLPLYSLSYPSPPSALAFAQIQSDHPGKFLGLSAEETHITGIKPLAKCQASVFKHWPTLLAHWETTLSHLAQAFQLGTAQADPKEGELTCRYCDLKSFCRIKQTIQLPRS